MRYSMKTKTVLRLISLLMLIIAVIFLAIAFSCPTCGKVFYIGPFRIDAGVLRIFYGIYAVTMVSLFVISIFIKKKK